MKDTGQVLDRNVHLVPRFNDSMTLKAQHFNYLMKQKRSNVETERWKGFSLQYFFLLSALRIMD